MRRIILSLIFLLHAAVAPLAQQPNIVVFLTDDQDDYESLRAMPNVNLLLAHRGVRFVNSFANNPVCAPSRASLLTCQATHNHGIWTNNANAGGGYAAFLHRDQHSLGPWMQAAGYRTAYIGKFVNPVGEEHRPAAGWDHWSVWIQRSGMWFDVMLNESGTLRLYGAEPSEYSTDLYARRAVEFIGQQTSQPFFLVVAPVAPHKPITPAPRHAGTWTEPMPRPSNFNETVHDKAWPLRLLPKLMEEDIEHIENNYQRRMESLRAVDELVLAVMRKLRQTGKLANTRVIFTSDNGWSNGSHRWWGKQFPQDRMSRVPLLIAGAGIPRGEKREQLVTNLDVCATILAWSGATATTEVDGLSLVPLLAAGGASAPWRDSIFMEGRVPGVEPSYWFTAIRTATEMHAEIAYEGTTESEHYDMLADPRQRTNIFGTLDAETQNGWRARIEQRRSCSGVSCNSIIGESQ